MFQMTSRFSIKNIFILLLLVCLTVSSQHMFHKGEVQDELPYGCARTRTELLNQVAAYDSSFAYSRTNGQLTLNGTQFFDDIYMGKYTSFSEIYEKYKGYQGGVIVYMLLFIIPYILGLILFPFLCCCCLCPDTCSCCTGRIRARPKVGAIILSTLSILMIGSIIIFSLTIPSINQLFTNSGCSVGIILDGLMNGSTSDSYRFLGVKQIGQIFDEAGNIQNRMLENLRSISSSGNLTQMLYSHVEEFSMQIQNISIDQQGNTFSLQYSSPIDSSNPTTQIPSLIPGFIGTAETPDTLLGITYQILTTLNSSWTQAVTQIDSSLSQISSYSNTIDRLNSSVHSQLETEERLSQSINDGFDFTQENVMPFVKLGYYGILAIAGTIGLIMGLGAMLSGYSDKYQCRYLLYCGCALSLLISVIIMALGMSLSASTLTSFYYCEYLGQSIHDPIFFQNHIGKMFKLDPGLTVCMADGDGNLTTAGILDVGNISEWVAEKDSIEQQFRSYNTPQYINQTIQNYEGVVIEIQGFRANAVIDLNSSSDIAVLSKLADYQSFPTCTAFGFNEDSWIPSIHQQVEYLPCKLAGPFSDNSTCPTQQNLQDRQTGCVGCMDTFSLFQNYSPTQVQTILQVRYPGCSQFATDMSNVWKNYYSEKNMKITPILNKVINLNSSIETLIGDVQSIDESFMETLALLDQTFDLVLNEDTGLLPGLNCRPIGDSIKVAIDLACTTYLPFSFGARVLMGIIAWSLLLFMVIATYVGTNAYKMSKIRRNDYMLGQNQSINFISPQDQGPYYGYFRQQD